MEQEDRTHQHPLLLHHRLSEGRRGGGRVLPAEQMVADFFTKPLQGASIRRFCDVVLNIWYQVAATDCRRIAGVGSL